MISRLLNRPILSSQNRIPLLLQNVRCRMTVAEWRKEQFNSHLSTQLRKPPKTLVDVNGFTLSPVKYEITRMPSGLLPIYRTLKQSYIHTKIKHIHGNMDAFVGDLKRLIPAESISVNYTNSSVMVKGDYFEIITKVLNQSFPYKTTQVVV